MRRSLSWMACVELPPFASPPPTSCAAISWPESSRPTIGRSRSQQPMASVRSAMQPIEAVGEPDDPDTKPPIVIVLDVVHEAGDWGSFARNTDFAQAAASALAAELDAPSSTACLALSSDANVAALNAAYRGKATP